MSTSFVTDIILRVAAAAQSVEQYVGIVTRADDRSGHAGPLRLPEREIGMPLQKSM